MLSILIPIYNFKVVKLVEALQKQCEKAKITYEIVCFDDQSQTKYKKDNVILSNYFGVNYTELSENLGRARIRNWMAKIASYDNLLFLDCDTKIISKSFVKDYLAEIENYDVISGGRKYNKKPPRAKSKKLHWLYGTKKESQVAKLRNKNAILYFHTNNFLVRRDIMLQHPLDEAIQGYGYEDLFWAKTLHSKGFTIKHIDNETEHLGLEKNKDFLRKQKEAIDNLIILNKKDKIETHLIKFAHRLERYNLRELFFKFYKKRAKKIEENLLSDQPKLINLDLYKLHHYFSKTRSTT